MQGMCVFGKAMEDSELYAKFSFPFLISKLLCAQLHQPQGCLLLVLCVFLVAATFWSSASHVLTKKCVK